MVKELPELLGIGLDDGTREFLGKSFKHVHLNSAEFDLEKFLEPAVPAPKIVLVSASSLATTVEAAQVLRGTYPTLPIFLVCNQSDYFERKDFIKNGFTDAFLLPLDRGTLKTTINEAIAAAGATELQVYRSVKLIDFEPGEPLDFDASVYLPSNDKYVKITLAGEAIDHDRLENIRKRKIQNLHVPAHQIQNFYDYSAKKLRKLSGAETVGLTERREKLSGAVRDLMSGMFSQDANSFQSGSEVLQTCSGIVSSYIAQGAGSDWFSRVQQIIGESGGHYAHSSNVSTLAALFSMGLGIGKPEDLALAGLLHDLGESLLPIDIQGLEPDQMNKEQFEIFKKHPEMSMDIIRQKKMVIPEIVAKAILQHHELFNGTGFPHAVFGDRICKEAQILSLADRFEHMTQMVPGRASCTPYEAVKRLRKEQEENPAHIKYQPELLKKLMTLFPE